MIQRFVLLAGLAAATLFSAQALAESGGTQFVTKIQGVASASPQKPQAEPRKAQPRKQAERKPAAKDQKADDAKPAHVELRSDQRERGLFTALFGGAPQMLPETQRRDAELRAREEQKGKKRFQVKQDLQPRVVDYAGNHPRGTIVVNTSEKALYLVESAGKARRYAIAVGRDGLKFKGEAKIQDKQEWPRWIPTKDMQKREPHKYARYAEGMPGGPDNPLGARAMYLYQGKRDTHIRIHGTNQPWTIGTDSSNGCFRMVNEHVMDLYNRVRLGANVIVL